MMHGSMNIKFIHQYCSLYRTHHLCGGGVEPARLFVVDFKVVACVAMQCGHVLCPVQFLFVQKMKDF
jgi:hypothetical protein